MITVAGGVYREICVKPAVDEIFGSAGRAAVALSLAGNSVTLSTYCPTALRTTIEDSFVGSGVALKLHDSAAQIQFRYLHPLARPNYDPVPERLEDGMTVSADHVLRFGLIEGTAIVNARKAVYDPQSSPETFKANGSNAEVLAIVLNTSELRARNLAADELSSVAALGAVDGAHVVIIKAGAVGARVYENGNLVGTVPPYMTDRVYKIGSGDMFSAGFTHAWCELGLSAVEAADYASRSAARYCDTRAPTLVSPNDLANFRAVNFQPERQVYIAGPFFTTSDLWMVEELWRSLRAVGATPFSPFHDIGLGKPEVIAPADLAALEASTAVLAVLNHDDPGTLFEVGYAVSRGIPVIGLSENPRRTDLSMLQGTDCFLTDDISTAVYRAAWASWQ